VKKMPEGLAPDRLHRGCAYFPLSLPPPAEPPGLTAAPLPDFWAWLSVLFMVPPDAPIELEEPGEALPFGMEEQAARAVTAATMARILVMAGTTWEPPRLRRCGDSELCPTIKDGV
jgi:hypothetical protein